MNNKIRLSNIKFIDENGNEKELSSGIVECGVDIGNKESESANGIFLSDGELSIDISNKMVKKFHRKRKGKRYLIYSYEEYSLFDDFKSKVFGAKIKYKTYKKLGSNKNISKK